jgi:putative acyl-CoA dehydrogenase
MPNSTHTVTNQAAPLVNYNLFATNRALLSALAFNAPGLSTQALYEQGARWGSAQMQEHARLAHTHLPVLHTHSRVGERMDTVEFHPSYHVLMSEAVSAGLHGAQIVGQSLSTHPSSGSTPSEASGVGTHLVRAAGFMLFTELEPATLCPISMTYAATPALRGNSAIWQHWAPKLAGTQYDSRLQWFAGKTAVTMGMGMTEKQGGSDVRANTTRAVLAGQDAWGQRYEITGHKWFFSAPMCDAFLVLAQTDVGLSCFFLPRVLQDGQRNAIAIQRLKDKLGNKANASSEVEFNRASAWLLGEAGRGVQQILEMGTMTRLDCALGTSGLMRQALSIALHHCEQRHAFGKALIQQPLMRNVLADLALESEAATALAIRLARAFDNPQDRHERFIARVLTPIAKFWICKRGSHFAQEAMECLGGNGYVEEGGQGVMARIYREMPLNSIWEGAGNIMALDLLRALRHGDAQGDVAAALAQELANARGAHPALDHALATLPMRVEQLASEPQARRLAQEIALGVQAALLAQHAPSEVYAAFCQSRLAGDWGYAYGTLGSGLNLDAIIQRAMPH